SRLEDTSSAPSQDAQDAIVAPATAVLDAVTPEPDWQAASGGVVEDETGEDLPEPEDTVVAAEVTGTSDEPEASIPEADTSWAARWPEPRAAQEHSSRDTWSWTGSTATAASTWETDTDDTVTESETIAPDASDIWATIGDEETPPAATGDEEDNDARERASELLEELRGLIWQIGTETQTEPNEEAIVQHIRRARGETGDFTDLDPVIAAVRDNPRDIDALRELGLKADRLQELLTSHQRLVRALESALRDS
ncbi:MAG TPA: hypothetical protein VNZ58_00895, partial [Thermomicrobiales bacterium]|nr:hypothetical protein [Thermomicrobiales bacterium]